MMRSSNYFGLPVLIAIILQFFLGGILSFVWRLLNGKTILFTILSFPLIFITSWIFWLADLISLIVNGNIEWLI